MPKVTLRSDGRYVMTVPRLDGTRQYLTGKSEREVQEKYDAEMKKMGALGYLANPGKITLNDLFSEFIDTIKHERKPRTVADYQSMYKRYIKKSLGTLKLSKITPTHLQNLYNKLREQDLERVPSQLHAILHVVLKHGVLLGYLNYNPADRVKKPSYHAPTKEVWTQEQFNHFLDHAREYPLYPVLVTIAATGCRIGEILSLTWDNVDLDKGIIRIEKNMQRIDKKWVISKPKTKAGERSVALPAYGISALKLQKARQAEWKLANRFDWDNTRNLVFTNYLGMPLHGSGVSPVLAKICERLNLPKLTPHGLRHWHVSFLIYQGVPITTIAARVGHQSPAITMRLYSHAIKCYQRL